MTAGPVGPASRRRASSPRVSCRGSPQTSVASSRARRSAAAARLLSAARRAPPHRRAHRRESRRRRRQQPLRRPGARLRVGGAHFGGTGGPAGLVRIGDRGLRLVVCRSHPSVRVRGAASRPARSVSRSTTCTRSRAPRARRSRSPARRARTRASPSRSSARSARRSAAATARSSSATRRSSGAHALRGLQQRLVDAAGSLRLALLHGGTRDPGRAAARTGAVGLQAGRTHGGVERPVERALGGIGRGPDPVAVPLDTPFLGAPAGQRGVPVSRARRLAETVVPLEDLLDDRFAGPARHSTPARGVRGRGHVTLRSASSRAAGW